MTDDTRAAITGVVLAGGRARRMGGRDKGLLELAGKPLAAHCLGRLQPQVGALLINANRNIANYATLGVPVVSDELTDFQGPLAGMLAAMAVAGTDYILTVPCDSPLLAADYAARMSAALIGGEAELAVAHDGERLQPVFALLNRSLQDDLRRALMDGERKIDRWYACHRMIEVDFSDTPGMFRNVNTPEELAVLEAELLALPQGDG